MKTLKQIKDEYAKSEYGTSFNEYEKHNSITIYDLDEISKLYAIEVAKKALINASESAKLDWQYFQFEEASPFIDKQSILNESNIPEL